MTSVLQSKLRRIGGGCDRLHSERQMSPLLLVLSALVHNLGMAGPDLGRGGGVLGFVAGIIGILMGGETVPQWGKYARVRAPGYLDSWGGAFSMGPTRDGWSGSSQWAHEYGYTWKNRRLGLFCPLIIAIRGMISATFPTSRSSFYTERWADRWSNWP